jgi:hypothetical protein
MLQELQRIESVKLSENKEDRKVELIRGAYIPSDEEAGKYQILGEDVALLISTIKHNILETEEAPLYQRKVAYDNVAAEHLDEFRKLANKSSQQLLVKLNKWLSQHDADMESNLETESPMKVGLGLYYFEEAVNDSTEKDK